ncbi:hypothetical protein [Modestobacter sp. URMC 112]
MSAGPGEQQDWDAVVPYTGPPSYGPGNPPPAYPPAAFGYPPPAWGPAPRAPSGPSRPGTTIAAAVLAFVLALLTLFGTVYAMVFSALLAVTRRSAGGLGPWISLVHLGLVAALVAGGVLVLGGRRAWLLAAAAAEVALSVYWAVVLDAAALPGLGGGVFGVPVVFAVLAAASAALAATPSARTWRPGRAAVPGS